MPNLILGIQALCKLNISEFPRFIDILQALLARIKPSKKTRQEQIFWPKFATATEMKKKEFNNTETRKSRSAKVKILKRP